jgi:glutamyl-tRNA reductase
MMSQSFRSLSLSYHNAPVEVRELFSLNEVLTKEALFQLRELLDLEELLILSTCNRTEVYYTSAHILDEEIVKLLGILKGISHPVHYLSYFRSFATPHAASEHLFEVALGLDSQVVGDIQIINQVKQAYQWSADLNLAGPFLHRLLHTIFFSNKRVRQETQFHDGAASVSYATVELVELIANGMLRDARILVLGLGEIGADVARNLAGKQLGQVYLCNRTLQKAASLARETGFKVIGFERVWEAIEEADIIISSIVREDPFISKTFVSTLPLYTFKYFIDLSVPRSIESQVEDLPGAIVYNIDDIQARTQAAVERRLQAIPHIREIIVQSLSGLDEWTQEMMLTPTIHKLKSALEQIRQEELGKHVQQLSQKEAQAVEKVTQGIIQRLLKMHILPLKAACKRGEAETLVEVLNELFDLEKQAQNE